MSDKTRRYDLIIFDWDGTLIGSVARIVAAVQAAAIELNLPVPVFADIAQGIGTTSSEQFQRLYGGQDNVSEDEFLLTFRDNYYDQPEGQVLFPGALELLQNLKADGYTLAVATGMSRHGLDTMLQQTQTIQLFDETRTADDGPSKPDPTILHSIMDACVVESSRAIMVGDTSYDLQAASNAGIASVGVTTGVHDRQTLGVFNPVAILDDLADLKALL